MLAECPFPSPRLAPVSAEESGFASPGASVNAPRAAGPKRPPRPTRDETEPPPGFAATATVVAPPADPTPAPVLAPDHTAEIATEAVAAPAATGRGRRTRRGRRVRRIVRRIDLWSVLKLSLVVYLCLYLSVLATLAALWALLHSTGSVDKLQSFLEDVGLDNFTFYGDQMFRACAAIGAIGVIAGTVVTVLATALVNLISEMTGGIRLVVIEEDVAP